MLTAATDMCSAYVEAFHGFDVAVATMGSPFGSETLCASGADAGRIAELQIDLGVGPSWDAIAARAPILQPEITPTTDATWPALAFGLKSSSMRSLYAFPLAIGEVGIGAVTLSAGSSAVLSRSDIVQATELTHRTTMQVLSIELARVESYREGADSVYSRREVHQATGMVIAQLGISADDALLILRAHAFASGQTVRETAAGITARRIVFSP